MARPRPRNTETAAPLPPAAGWRGDYASLPCAAPGPRPPLVRMRIASSSAIFGTASFALVLANAVPFFVAPTDVQLPGTQANQAYLLGPANTCLSCHGQYDQA